MKPVIKPRSISLAQIRKAVRDQQRAEEQVAGAQGVGAE